jgi:hypothetical protein
MDNRGKWSREVCKRKILITRPNRGGEREAEDKRDKMWSIEIEKEYNDKREKEKKGGEKKEKTEKR